MHFGMRRFSGLVALTAAVLMLSAAPAAAQSSGWQGGPGAILDNTYTGFVDVPAGGSTVPAAGSFAVSGWFVDTTAQGWAGADDVQVWLGTMDGGGQMIAHGLTGQNRPDVATALNNPFWAGAGFTAIIPGSSVPSGAQTLSVYMHTGGKGWWFKQVGVTGGGSGTGTASAPTAPTAPSPGGTAGGAPVVTVTTPTAGADVSTKSDYIIQGSVSDPGVGAGGIDRIEVYINGERGADHAQLLGTTTPDSAGNWNVTFTPTHFTSQHTNIYVYAHSKTTGLETVFNRDFNITDRS